MNNPWLRSYELAYIANPLVSVLVLVGPGRFLPATIESCLAQKYREVEVVCAVADAGPETARALDALRARDARVKVYAAPDGSAKDPARLASLAVAKATGRHFLAAPRGAVFRADGLHAMVAAAEALGQAVAAVPGSVRALARKRAAAKADRSPERFLGAHGAPLDGFLIARALLEAADLPARQKNPFDPSFAACLMLRVPPERFRCVPAAAFWRPPAAVDLTDDAAGLAFELAQTVLPLKAYPDWARLLSPAWASKHPDAKAQTDASFVHAAFARLLRAWREYGHAQRAVIARAASAPFVRALRLSNVAPPPGTAGDRGDKAALWAALTGRQ